VPGLRRLAAEEIGEVEPNARGVAALHSPNTGVVDFGAVAEAYADDVREAGGAIATRSAVTAIRANGAGIELEHGRGATSAGFAVFCAGGWSDRLAVMAGAPAEPRIVPFRGGYLRLRPERSDLVRANVYPVPDPELPFLGAHLTKSIDGEVLLGPSALLVGGLAWPGTWRVMRRHWRTGAREMRHALNRGSYVREARRLVPALSARDVTRGFSGTRAQAIDRDGTLVDDFVVHRTERALHIRNAPSPAATSSLAIARLIADQVDEGSGG
jgi:2-hydroxyglutarate dehydrogenase